MRGVLKTSKGSLGGLELTWPQKENQTHSVTLHVRKRWFKFFQHNSFNWFNIRGKGENGFRHEEKEMGMKDKKKFFSLIDIKFSLYIDKRKLYFLGSFNYGEKKFKCFFLYFQLYRDSS